MREELILASKSPFRAQLLANAGVQAEICGANIDERAVEAGLPEASPPELAQALAEAKAKAVSSRFPQAVIIGCDQILELDGAVLHKAANEEEAFQRLTALSGRTHRLHSAYAAVRGGALLSAYGETAEMTMRAMPAAALRAYLKQAGETALKSVGVYQIEGIGIRLFEAIKGDYWAIVGLPLLPLLADLRRLGLAGDFAAPAGGRAPAAD